MTLVVYTTSVSFENHLSSQLQQPFSLRHDLSSLAANDGIHLVHLAGFSDTLFDWLKNHPVSAAAKLIVCADNPQLTQMLTLADLGVKAYCNSYMRGPHFQQMLQMVEQGQSWFPPVLLQQTFDLARKAVAEPDTEQRLSVLTEREKQTALAVSRGLSNRAIAEEFDISERTVKTHLTSIFKKLDLKDRVALVLYLKQA
jgi:DNA-binding NarL/FixJ family response regulator